MNEQAPWLDFQPSPQPTVNPDTKPWEDFSSIARSTPSGFPEPQTSDNPLPGEERPPGQKAIEMFTGPGGDITQSSFQKGAAIGSLTSLGVSGMSKLFEDVPDLLDAGIKPRTLQSMTPQGVTSTEYAKTLQQELNNEGLIGKTSNDTLKNFIKDTDKAGKDVGSARDAIAQSAGPQAVTINAQAALQPIYDAWGKEVNAIVPDNKTISTFGKYYDGLMKIAQNQGGQLTLDNIHDFLQEIGPKVHAGSEANQEIFSKLYGVGMDAQKGMINAVAKNAGDETLASNLLDANARFTRNLRLLPDIARNDAGEAIKAGISAFQKYGGPSILKYGTAVAGTLTGEELIKKLYHTLTGGSSE